MTFPPSRSHALTYPLWEKVLISFQVSRSGSAATAAVTTPRSNAGKESEDAVITHNTVERRWRRQDHRIVSRRAPYSPGASPSRSRHACHAETCPAGPCSANVLPCRPPPSRPHRPLRPIGERRTRLGLAPRSRHACNAETCPAGACSATVPSVIIRPLRPLRLISYCATVPSRQRPLPATNTLCHTVKVNASARP